MILNAEIRQSECDKLAELIVVEGEEDVPIDVFGHWYLDFLLLVPLDAVDLSKYDEAEHLDEQD